MASIFTRKAITQILADENLTPEERTERVFSLYGQALDEGFISKNQAQATLNAAIEQAKSDALKDVKHPDVKETEEFKKLQSDFDAYKAMQTARTSDDFKSVKPKFFETVYGMVDRSEGAKPVADQLSEIAGKYEEYFSTAPAEKEEPAQPAKPSFGAPTEGSVPSGKTGPSFNDFWGFPEGKK